MKQLVIGAALLALCGTAAAQPQPRGLEEDYGDWRSVDLDQKTGVAIFVAARKRAGNAVLFRVLKVHRNLVEAVATRFDKEMVEMLGDCDNRTLLLTAYRNQIGNTPTLPLVIPRPEPAVAKPASTEGIMLASACGETQDEPVVASPYAWAKARLQEGGK